MSKLAWDRHRLRAMTPAEMALHARKKLRQFRDARGLPDWSMVTLDCSGAYPKLPNAEDAPEVLRSALRHDVEEILAGRWKAFGHLDLRVDDPPRWHKDYLVNRDCATDASAFKLDHRALPDGADIKLIWELSRWNQLVRLAMAAFVLGEKRAATKCLDWLEDWVKHNPPYHGWNWTSALEVGMRLIQFAWIDALLSAHGVQTTLSNAATAAESRRTRLSALREQILASHVYFAWRHRSFGSSANNHLLGELVGLIVASVRWPAVQRWAAPLEQLQFLWQREVLAQFAEDGGNKEQALNYHLFSWEFCWQARLALLAVGREPSEDVEDRISAAARFFWEVQVRHEPWDYGDSDNAVVTPWFAHESTLLIEWRDWLSHSLSGAGATLEYWQGDPPDVAQRLLRSIPLCARLVSYWWIYESSGIAVCQLGQWQLRWDLSPLGYLSTAAHGHQDALHLSLWFNDVAVVIDPGTGAYYADSELRARLASRVAHNGPDSGTGEFSKRGGPFLWSEHHPPPTWKQTARGLSGELLTRSRTIRRAVLRAEVGDGWSVQDEVAANSDGGSRSFTVRWQFAPGAWVKRLGQRTFSLHRAGVAVQIEVDDNWAEVELHEPESRDEPAPGSPARDSLEGIVSPSFRRLERAPFLKLTARPHAGQSCVFRTTFLASPHS